MGHSDMFEKLPGYLSEFFYWWPETGLQKKNHIPIWHFIEPLNFCSQTIRAELGEPDTPEHLTQRRHKTSQEHKEHSLEAGFVVKYLTMERCNDGILQQHSTAALMAMMPRIERLGGGHEWRKQYQTEREEPYNREKEHR